MRSSLRLLAVAKPSRFLEPSAPTGLAGLLTHPTPRTTLIHLYNTTLSKLSALPETSLYRQSTEALTKHRLAIIEATKPDGYAEWKQRAEKQIAEAGGKDKINILRFAPEAWGGLAKAPSEGGTITGPETHVRVDEETGKTMLTFVPRGEGEGEMADTKITSTGEVAGAKMWEPSTENGNEEVAFYAFTSADSAMEWEMEPALRKEQIQEIEEKIGAGLIEEVIEVAKGELSLVDTMAKHQVWEDLEEKPVEGQWTYFKRDTHTKETQPPPK